LRTVLEAPQTAAFANEIITAGKDGARTERWIFLDDDGVEVGRRDVATTSFDPRQRPWYGPARHSDLVQRSDLYIFALNNEPGFSLSGSFTAAMPGVFGADLAASDLSHFLSKQRVTPSSVSFIFTRSGEIVAFPDEARVAALVPRNGDRRVGEPLIRTQYIEAERSASIARMTTTRFGPSASSSASSRPFRAAAKACACR
jgi:hypothetical protein